MDDVEEASGANAHDEEKADADVDEEIEHTEARKAKTPADPGQPTQKEIDEHNISHWPFRPWCPYCCAGKSVSSPHKHKGIDGDELKTIGMPTVSLDYCWASGKEEMESDDNDEKDMPVLIMYVDVNEAMSTLPVSKKGPVAWVVAYMVDN